MLKKDVTLKMLGSIATMMNKVLGYKDPILTGKGILRKDLYDEVADAAQDIELGDLEHEDFTDDMVTWLEVMGWEKPVAPPVEKEKAEEPDEKVTKPEEAHESPVEEKKEPKTELSKEKAKTEPKKKAAKKTPAKKTPAKKTSRIEAAIVGIKNNKSIKAAAKKANETYVEGGGHDHINYAYFYVRLTLKIMAGVGVATVEGDKYTIGK